MFSLRFALAGAVLVAHVPAAHAVDLYFTAHHYPDASSVYRTTAGSGTAELLVSYPYNNQTQMVQTHGSSLYWSTINPGVIWRGDLNAGQAQSFVAQGSAATAIRFYDDKMYWASDSDSIYRSDLDGSNVELVISGYQGYDLGIWDFDIYDDRIYWTSWHSAWVKTTDLNGADFQRLRGNERTFNVEVENGKIYFTSSKWGPPGDWGKVFSMNLDGGDKQLLIEEQTREFTTLDYLDGRLYYCTSQWGEYSIKSVGLGGGASRTEFVGDMQIFQVHAIPAPPATALFGLGIVVFRRRRRS